MPNLNFDLRCSGLDDDVRDYLISCLLNIKDLHGEYEFVTLDICRQSKTEITFSGAVCKDGLNKTLVGEISWEDDDIIISTEITPLRFSTGNKSYRQYDMFQAEIQLPEEFTSGEAQFLKKFVQMLEGRKREE